jgi:aminoglycoside phosphotransferase (APT) family kinase protein
LGVDEPAGLLYEERLPLEPLVLGKEECLHALGACLAGLHAQPIGPDEVRRTLRCAHDQIDLLARVADAGWLAALPAPSGIARRIHGDAHLGQLACSGGRPVLLDLDECSIGTAEEDLATVIAEALVRGDGDWNTATRALFDGYRSAGGPELARLGLVRAIAHALCETAAATLRRLERGAVAEARRRLELARSLPGSRVTAP